MIAAVRPVAARRVLVLALVAIFGTAGVRAGRASEDGSGALREDAPAATAPVLVARANPASDVHRGFRIDLSEIPANQRPRHFESLHAQIDLVADLPIKPAILDFFRTITIHVDPAMTHGGRATRGELFLAAAEMAPDDPFLLRELIHVYHEEKLPSGRRNPDLIRFYERAKASGEFPTDVPMMKNVREYFARTASVVLSGQASRPPSSRELVKRTQPQLYAWIVREFGLVE